MAAEAKVKLSVQGAQRVRATLRGIRRDSHRSGQAQERVARDGTKAVDRAERDKRQDLTTTDRMARAFQKGQLQEARRSARQQMRVSAQLARARIRDAERAARREEKLRRKLADESKTGGGGGGRLSRLGSAALGAVAGGVAGGVADVGRARQIAGVKSREQRIQSAADYQLNLTRLANAAGLSDNETAVLDNRVQVASKRYGLDQNAVLGGIKAAQERFGTEGFARLAPNVDEMAKAASALDIPLSDVVGMLGTFQKAMKLTSEEVRESMSIVLGAASEGAVDPQDFSRAFAGEIGSFASSTGATGIEGVRQFVGVSQAVGAGQFGADESATRVRALLTSLSSGPTKREAVKFLRADESTKAVGDRLKRGENIDVREIAAAFASREDFRGSRMAEIFGEVRGRQGIQAMVKEERAGSAVAATKISQIDAGFGEKLVNKTWESIADSAGIAFAKEAAKAQADITENLDDYAEHVLGMTKASRAFEEAVGEFGLYTNTVAGAIGGLGLGALLKMLAGGSTAASGGGMISGALSAVTGAVTGGSVMATVGSALLAGGSGIASYGLTSKAFEWSGADEKILQPIGEAVHSWLNESADEIVSKSIGQSRRTEEKQLQHAERQTRALETLVRQTGKPPGGGGAPTPQPEVPGRGGR